ncbi:CcmD family protein [Alicyclobacillus cycloheptanicus]|uniref:CcmD family protein n=1 Tax=Alicyclobacillus cycloheptanicus TaxID=1457 RepID=A0ABT9XDM3_9BACL|nr:CcmD family protein [Alicyclobacillus cycloheptanicus]MDQ0188399.1 CcmD family protein [Alicyclobacillus cycloheptanicus]WDM01104.1 CcmD family protein [Alicyclobacillus cycloheptanicus]
MLNEMGFLWAAAAVVWLATLVYVAGLLRRQGQVQKQLEQLERTLETRRNNG